MPDPTTTSSPNCDPVAVVATVMALLAQQGIKDHFSTLEVFHARRHASALLLALGVVPVPIQEDGNSDYTGREDMTGQPVPSHVEGYRIATQRKRGRT